MIHQQKISDYNSSLSEIPSNGRDGAGYFAAVRLEEFSAESLEATTVYSRKDFYKISLITGHATYHYRDRAYLFEPGDFALVFTNREVPYRWQVHDGTCSGYSCMFTEDFLPLHTYIRPTDWSVFDETGQSVFRLDSEQKEIFILLFQKMLAEQESGYQHKYDLLFLYVMECVHGALKLAPFAENRTLSATGRITDAFKILLAGQFPLVQPSQKIQHRTPQAFADQLSVHINYLNRALKEITGKTTSQLINERIMQEARALLLHSNWSVSQISNSLGFDEATHFARAFRSYTGQTPSSLRQPV